MRFNNSLFLMYGICIITIYSCNIQNTPETIYGIKGTALDATTGECIPYASIYLLESDDSGGPWSPPAYYYVDSLITDAYGRFEFIFEKTIGYGYALFATKEHYIEGTALTFVQYGEIKDVLLNPEAFFKLYVRNIPPSLPSDQLSINGPLTAHFYGEEVDTISIYKVNGNVELVFYWGLNGTYVNTDTLYFPAFDTTYFELLY